MKQAIFVLSLWFLGFMALAEPKKALEAKTNAKEVEAKKVSAKATKASVTKAVVGAKAQAEVTKVSAKASPKPKAEEAKKVSAKASVAKAVVGAKAQAEVTKVSAKAGPKSKAGEGLEKPTLSEEGELNKPVASNQEVISAKQLRNGFVDAYLFGGYSFYKFPEGYSYFGVSSYFGEVNKTVFDWFPMPEYYLEGGGGVTLAFFGTSEMIAGLKAFSEVNFIKNDGSYNLIPGLRLTVGLEYYHNKQEDDLDFFTLGFELGIFYKMFVSKRFALIPYVGVGYNFVFSKSNEFPISAQLHLRRYF